MKIYVVRFYAKCIFIIDVFFFHYFILYFGSSFFGLPFTASQYCFGKVFPVWNVPAFCFMHANCPNGDGNQSNFGRFRYYYVNYRTTSKVMCIANRRTPYFKECRSLSLNTSLKRPRILYAVAQSVSADSRSAHAPATQVQTDKPELFFSSSCFWLAVHGKPVLFGNVFPVWTFPAFYFIMHVSCPNGDGTQSSFGRFRYYYVTYRTFAKR